MKTYRAMWVLTLVGMCGLIGGTGARAQTDPPIFVNRAFVGQGLMLGFFPNTTDWVSLEASSDFLNWTHVASISTTNNVTVFLDEEAGTLSRRFYRLIQPGLPVEDTEAIWLLQAHSNYRLQLQHVRSTHPYVLSATVSVTEGQKLISGAEADGQPIDEPDPNDFPSVDELFAALKQAQQSGCWRVAVVYDAAHAYPAWCVIEEWTGELVTGKQVSQYRITGFTPTP